MENTLNLDKKNKNIIEQQFINFLNKSRIKNGTLVKPSHTGISKHSGKFLVDESNEKEFYELYKQMMMNHCDIHLIEQHTDNGPFIIDIDLRFNIDLKTRQYSVDFIKKVCEVYQKNIIEYFENPNVLCFVFERPSPYLYKHKANGVDSAIMKDGIHLMFPHIVSSPAVQKIIRENVIKELEEIGLFKTIPTDNTIYDAIDKLVIDQVGWYMYGSTKENVARYELTYVINSSLEIISKSTYNENDLPRFLSIRNQGSLAVVRESKVAEIENYEIKDIVRKQSRKRDTADMNYDTQEICELVMMLNPKRADEYSEWRDLAFALHSIDASNDDLLNIFDDFSQKSSKYEPGCCQKFWSKIGMRDTGGINIGSLYWWAKNDSPDKFSEFKNNRLMRIVEGSISGTNVDIARVLYKLYKNEWACISVRTQKWYRFENHGWEEDECGIQLRMKISNELVNEYLKLVVQYNKNIERLEEDVLNEMDKKKKFEITQKIKVIENRINIVIEITNKLKTTSFIDNVMKECKGIFYDKIFLDKLDENHYLIGFKNGVLDLTTGNFRDGFPSDYISLRCNVNYIKYSEDMEYLDDINDFLRKIQPKPELRKYMLTFISSLLEGHNADESFHFWTGSGGNGKSKLNELLVGALGNYAIKFPITLFTQKRGASNSVSPEIVESKGKRYAYMEEPSENENINIGLMKEYTGGDIIKGRGLWSNFQEFKPQFKLVLFCNDMPKVPSDDKGTWRRIKVLQYLSSFVDNPVEENEFSRDKQLSEKLPKWRETFMSIMVHYYFTEYKTYGLQIPRDVEIFTTEYQKDMDMYVDFIDKFLIKTDKKTDKISFQEIHDNFKAWFQQNMNSYKFPVKNEMKKHFEKKYGKRNCSATHLIGFIKNNEYDNDGEEAA